jgi:hypothetical protein
MLEVKTASSASRTIAPYLGSRLMASVDGAEFEAKDNTIPTYIC